MFIKTVSTTSGINPIKFDETGGVFYWILNTGSSTIYASTKSAFTAGDDGVVSLGPKESRRLETNNDTIYILGEGQVEIHNQRDGICSFKQAPTSSGGGDNRFYLVKDWENVNGAMGFYGYTGLVSSDNGVFIRGYSHFQHIDTKSADGIPRGNYSRIGVSLTADEFYYLSFSKSYVERKYIKLCLLSQRTNSSMFKSINSLDGSLAYNQIDSKYILALTLAPIENVMAYSSVDYAYYNGTFYLDIPDDIETLFIDIESAALNVKINSLWLE